jgi:DNA-binding transcriptional ArsR family regulator
MNKKNSKIEEALYARQVSICKAFANPIRLRILDLVSQHVQPACALQKELAISKANLSQHLAVLKGAGIVSTRRNGKSVDCELALPEVKQACALIRDVLRAQIRNGRNLGF